MTVLAIPDDHMDEVLREYQAKEREPSDKSNLEVIVRPEEFSAADWQEITQAQQ